MATKHWRKDEIIAHLQELNATIYDFHRDLTTEAREFSSDLDSCPGCKADVWMTVGAISSVGAILHGITDAFLNPPKLEVDA